MLTQERLYTAKDLADMPDDGKQYELHNGVLIEVAGSKYQQTRLAIWIAYLLTRFIMEHKLGGAITGADGTFELNPYNTRIPDVGYLSAARAAQQDDNRYPVGAPDLAIEVVSPSNSPREMQERAGEYLAAGALLIWIVNAQTQTVDVYQPGGQRDVFSLTTDGAVLSGYAVLPGLSLSLNELFAPFESKAE